MSHDSHAVDDIAQEPEGSGRFSVQSSLFDDDVDRIAPVVEDGPRDDHTEDPTVDSHDSSSAQQQLVSKAAQQANPVTEPAVPALRYRKASLWLLACYIPFLILPWILTCIMVNRPPSLPSYYNQKGEYCGYKLLGILYWFVFVRILNSIASVLVVPVTSALLAHGAVVYTQRRKSEQKANLIQTFALSDRGWSDIPILWSAYRKRGSASKYLKLATCLLLLSVIQAPVQQALIGYKVTVIMTCADLPFYDPPILGYDPEPQALAITPQIMVIPGVIKSLATVTDMDMQTYLWHDTTTDWSVIRNWGSNNAAGSTFRIPYDLAHAMGRKMGYFVSAFPNTTETGVLREHVMRLNSSAECKTIDEIAFPETCDGPDPLVASYNSQVKPPQYYNFTGFGNFNIDVCVPGNLSASPWTLSRDRQDITENLYTRVYVDYETTVAWGYYDGLLVNFTVQCTANTTRGYFELPNSQNEFTAGPLLEKWPDNETLWNHFNDYLNDGIGGMGTIPSAVDNFSVADFGLTGNWRFPIDPFNRGLRRTPGPLMTSALAMFGKDSFFYVASNSSADSYPSVTQQICQAGNIPFTRLGTFSDLMYKDMFYACNDINSAYTEGVGPSFLDPMLYQWFSTFYPQNGYIYSNEPLEVAMFFANQHWLTETAAATNTDSSARNIYTSPGFALPQPVVPLYAKIIVSILIALQLFGLGVLARYIYSVPTWTEKLDSCAIAQLTHDVDSSVFEMIKRPNEKTLQQLKDCSGLVGVAEESNEDNPNPMSDEQSANSGVDAIDASSSQSNEENQHVDSSPTEISDDVKLVRGGTGFVTRQHASFTEWKPRCKEWKPKLKRRKATKESMLEKGDK